MYKPCVIVLILICLVGFSPHFSANFSHAPVVNTMIGQVTQCLIRRAPIKISNSTYFVFALQFLYLLFLTSQH